MSNVRKAPWPVAVCASDLHIWHTPPVARSNDNWLTRVRGYFREVAEYANKRKLPFIVAGDIFHKWNVPSECVLLAMRCFKLFEYGVYTIPGQHDLPYHNELWNRQKSGYAVLEEAGVIRPITPDMVMPRLKHGWDIRLHPGYWSTPYAPIPPCAKKKGGIDVLVAHKYVWESEHTSYPGASQSGNINRKVFKHTIGGYDAALFGDNHKGFFAKVGRTNIMNGGTFICRNSDEMNYKPRFGILMADGTFKCKYINTKDDIWLDPKSHAVLSDKASKTFMLALLEDVNASYSSVPHALRQAINKLTPGSSFGEALIEILEHLENEH